MSSVWFETPSARPTGLPFVVLDDSSRMVAIEEKGDIEGHIVTDALLVKDSKLLDDWNADS